LAALDWRAGYLFLAPLSVGTHTLHFGGAFGADLGFFEIDTTYVITVALKK
jgi:hypothetical protein